MRRAACSSRYDRVRRHRRHLVMALGTPTGRKTLFVCFAEEPTALRDLAPELYATFNEAAPIKGKTCGEAHCALSGRRDAPARAWPGLNPLLCDDRRPSGTGTSCSCWRV